MTLYLKYRPKNLDELDLVDVSGSLKKILSSDQIPHAFLFAGPKGTGKTSAARILAKIINCEGKNPPCDKCEQCLTITKGTNMDVIEMDAASHRGIDDIRILRDAVKLAPSAAKKKIYIIDEAHMLTTEASNALLKTLEEPPSHVVFILATTNPEKLIDTIKSRVTYIPFRKANTAEIVRSLKRVVTGEKIKIDDDALDAIARASDGAFRDAIKILEQLDLEGEKLTKDFLEEYLFKQKSFNLEQFINLLQEKNIKALINEISEFTKKGVSITIFLTSLISTLRQYLLIEVGAKEGKKSGFEKHDLINLIDLLVAAFSDSENAGIEELPLEIALIKYCDSEMKSDIGRQKTDNEKRDEKIEVPEEKEKIQNSEVEIPTSFQSSDVTSQTSFPSVNDDAWKMILSQVRPLNASIEALLRSAKPVAYDGKMLTLGVYYKFHKERLEDTAHRKILEDVVTKVLNSPTRVSCTLVEPPPQKIIEEAKKETVLTEGADRDIVRIAEDIFSN